MVSLLSEPQEDASGAAGARRCAEGPDALIAQCRYEEPSDAFVQNAQHGWPSLFVPNFRLFIDEPGMREMQQRSIPCVRELDRDNGLSSLRSGWPRDPSIGYYCGVARPRSLETLVVYSDSAPMILGGAARRARLACPNSCCAPKVDPDASYAGLMPADSVCFGFVTRTASTQETHRNRK
jgi:hypothetical protein